MHCSDYQFMMRTIARLANAAHLQSYRVAVSHDVTGLELVCLRWIAAGQPLSVSDLVLQSMIPQDILLTLMDALEARGLITITLFDDERESDSVVLLALANAGWQVVENAQPPIAERLWRRIAPLPAEDKALLAEAGRLLTELLQAEEEAEQEDGRGRWPTFHGTS